MITKNSVVKIQNLVVNHKSRLIKSNPTSQYDLCFCTFVEQGENITYISYITDPPVT